MSMGLIECEGMGATGCPYPFFLVKTSPPLVWVMVITGAGRERQGVEAGEGP